MRLHHLLPSLLCFLLLQTAFSAAHAQSTQWIEAQYIGIEGQGWTETAHPFDRLPARAEQMVRKPLWELSHHTAGMCVHFSTNSKSVKARYTNRFNSGMPHMSDMGVKGVDLYVKKDGTWHWAGASKTSEPSWEGTLIDEMEPMMREFRLYLPTYDGIESLALGIDSTARLTPLKDEKSEGTLVFYGTSIMQGCSVSRPGMVPTAIIGRHLNHTTINLGFSGNGKLEPEMARLMGELDASCYVIDCTPNLNAEEIEEKTISFVKLLTSIKPGVPIVLVGNAGNQKRFILPSQQNIHHAKNSATKSAFRHLKKNKLKKVFLVKDNDLIGVDGEATIDGIHYTDLGYMRYVEAIKPAIKKALKHSK